MAAHRAAIYCAAHEQMAVALHCQRHFLRIEKRVRLAGRAGGLAAVGDGLLLLCQMERRWHVGTRQWLLEHCGAGAGKKNAQPTAAILDSQSVKNAATSTVRVGYDAGKRIKGRKRFFLVDTLGNLLASCVVAANCHDGATAARLWDALALGNELLDQLQLVFVDGGFGKRFRQHLAQRHIQAQVPTGVLVQKGRFFIHAKRWVVERSIAWAGNNRRLAKDYERKTQHANAWLYVANIRRLARVT